MKPKYPHIKVQLTGYDGNSFFILNRMIYSLKRKGISQEEVDQFVKEATSGDYHNLLRTCMEWVDVS